MGIVSALEKIVGHDRVSTAEPVCLSYSFNIGYTRDIVRKPDIVVMAETVEQVTEILKLANQYKVPVTPKGAAGGAGTGGPLKGGILLDLALMDRIILIDPINMKAIAEAGCSFYRLSQEVFKKGMILPTTGYGPAPCVAASAITPPSAVGAARYGPNINLVEGLEVVLPLGEIIRVGSMAYADSDFGAYHRYITGPDLVGLFTKSNGAFGIVTKVAYRCPRRARLWATHSYYWPSEKMEDVTKAMIEATAVETFDVHLSDIMWESAMAGTLPEDCHFVLLLMVNAENKQELNGKEQLIHDICTDHGGTYSAGFAQDFYTQWPTDLWWFGRVTEVQAKRPRGLLCLLDEPMYPISRVPEVYTKIMELSEKHGLGTKDRRGLGFDGFIMNSQTILSPIPFFLDDSDPDQVERFYKCQDEFRQWFGTKGGTTQYRLPPAVPDYVWTNQSGAFNLLKTIKATLDPNNILSPGTFEL
jgi:glycolate oxidase